MNISQWRTLFFKTINAVYYSETSLINVHDLPKTDYPVLHRLENLSTLEVLLLAWLIITGNDSDLGVGEQTFTYLKEVFDKFVITQEEFEEALSALHEDGWVHSFIDVSNSVCYKANLNRLAEEGLLTSIWDLGDLGLYKNIGVN